jgi:sugar lactone lactonase YvrE
LFHEGFLYVCDNITSHVRKVDVYDGSVTTFCSTVGVGEGLHCIAIDTSKTNFYVTRYSNATIYKIPIATGIGSVFKAAGTGNMASLAIDSDDNIYFTVPSIGAGLGTVRKVTQAGVMTTIDSGVTNPTGIVIGPDGNLYYVIQNQFYIKKYILPSGPSSIVAGVSGSAGLLNTNNPLTSKFMNPYFPVFDTNAYAATGSLVMYVTDEGKYIRKIVLS